MAQELNISKRVLRNLRVSGKMSYTNPFGKVFYYRQEIAAIMEASKKAKKGMWKQRGRYGLMLNY